MLGRVRVTSRCLSRSKSMMHIQVLITTGHRASMWLFNPSLQPPKPTCVFAPLAALPVGCLPSGSGSAEYSPPSHCPPGATAHFLPSPPPGTFLPEVRSVAQSPSSWVIFMDIEQGLCQVLPFLLKVSHLSHLPLPSGPTPSPPPAQ